MFATAGQGYSFLLCVMAGACMGVVYDACFLIRYCLGRGRAVTVVADALFCVLSSLIAVGAFYYFLLEFRFYVFAGMAVGFILQRFSLGYFIAKTADVVYNCFVALKQKILSSRLSGFFRRVFR